MKKLFKKYFFSIFAIAVIVLIIQNGFLLLKYSQSQNKWQQIVYDDFVDRLEENLKKSSFPNLTIDSIAVFSSSLEDSRVSGFLVRDPDGKVSFTVGQTSSGVVLTSIAPRNMMIAERGTSISKKAYSTILNVTYNNGEIKVERNTESTNKNYLIPMGINANDVIGTVTIMYGSRALSSIDILSYSPSTYAYSKDIIINCQHSILVATPICLLISLACAWIISSTNTKYIDSIRKALKDLANGKKNVKLKPNKNSSLNEITIAVNELDKTLQANEKSRQDWLTNISHDLNTPATAMRFVIDGLNDGVYEADKKTLEDLKKNNDILCDRINRVIEFSSFQSDTKPKIEFITCTNLLNQFSGKFEKLRTKFEIDGIRCDVSLMTKAIYELIKNAYAYSADQKATVEIKFADGNYCILVRNKGSLPKDIDINELFEPWTKGDFSRSTAGNGLGLPIVGAVAKKHNGKAVISSNRGYVTATIVWSL